MNNVNLALVDQQVLNNVEEDRDLRLSEFYQLEFRIKKKAKFSPFR